MLFVSVFVLCTWAGVAFAEDTLPTGTSVENRELGWLDVDLDDQGTSDGAKYWVSAANTNSAIVTAYSDALKPYDYAAKGMTRNAYLEKIEPTTNKFVALNLESPLERLILSRGESGEVSNLYMTAEVYSDTLVKFSPSITEPTIDDEDRIIVWMKETELDNGSVETNLMVTAGCYAGDYKKVTAVHYVVTNVVAADTWCRLTIRAIPDITQYASGIARRAPAFILYLDGAPVVIDKPEETDDWRVIGADSVDTSVLSAEARLLMGARRLFPWLSGAASSHAMALSRFSFAGLGALDDIAFSTNNSPSYVVSDNVFTLKWDAGIIGTDMLCIVSNAMGVVTNEIDATALPRYRDFSLGTNQYALVTVTNVVYDTALGYSNGVWTAESGCALKGGHAFEYAGQGGNPIGHVVSTRNVIGVGGSGFDTFKQAKEEAAKKGGVQTILLMTNIVISTQTEDKGVFTVGTNDNLVLDLNGYTLQGSGADATVTQKGGKLRITDTSPGKTGRVLPTPGRNGREDKPSVRVTASQTATPRLTIDAGWFDGAVVVTGTVATIVGQLACKPECYIEGGSYTNVYADTRFFYLEEYVTNSVYFGLGADDYWTTAATGYIWCGKGKNNRWDNADNWKGKEVPTQSTDLAIFPPAEITANGWKVDFRSGVAPKRLWLDDDITLSGTNEFGDVTVVSGDGRFGGNGMMTFTGKLPGLLTGDTGTGEVRLNANWNGRIKIIKSLKTQAIQTMMGWGTSQSTVEMNGVCGYLSDRSNHALPYGLVLTDYVTDEGATTNSAWRNDVGYTGSVISFPTLSGTGTFESPKNLREILQVFQFKDVANFTGRFKLGGKRVLLGTGSIVAQSKAGHFTFSNAVRVNSGLDWTGVSAHFGTNLVVNGKFGDRLMTYTGTTSEVAGVTVNLVNGNTGRLDVVKQDAGHAIIIRPLDLLNFGGTQMAAESIASHAKAGETFEVPDGSAVTIDGNRIIVNGAVVASFADHYKIQQKSGSTYIVKFDEAVATPSMANVSIENGKVVLQVTNAKKDLLYGLQTATTLGDDAWQGPTEWKQAEDDTVQFDTSALDSAAFFRVIMTDKISK